MIGQDDIIFSEDGDMLVHEESIQSTVLSKEELAILEASKDAARIVQELKREVTPNRVALAGVILLLLVGAIFSGWYWVIPRDSVTVETLYIQRGGHIVMSEIHNDGSREITDVSMDVKFQSLDGEVIEIMSIEVEKISSHSSVAGDDLEMQIDALNAAKNIDIKVPLVVRLAGTNEEKGKEILDNSGLDIISADNLGDAAKKVVKSIKEL